ncbi:MAG: hypothetical protein E7596_00690 [Ruminococcaceae bacterium]|nr:hypothetical protein [Oscillospiraceae bacterium]
MNGINQRLYNELFEKREVSCFLESYRDIYDQIWPCENLFKQFLSSNDTSVKMDTAKKIYFYIQMYDNFFLPSNYINNTIDYQERYKVNNTLGYIPQDHVIHSVNTYILGVYLFFNMTVLNKKLLDQILYAGSNKDKIQIFIKNWRCFAFYHDVGYYWETNFNSVENQECNDGKESNATRKDNSFWYDSIYFYVIKSVARLIVNIAFLRNSDKKFCLESLLNNINCIWIYDGETIDLDGLNATLHEFDSATMICDSDTLYGLGNSYPLLEEEKHLCVIFDQTNTAVAFIIKESNKFTKCIFRENYYLDVSNARLPEGWYCKYFVSDFKNNILRLVPTGQFGIVFAFFDNLPEKHKNQFDFYNAHNCEINDFYNCICEWLILNTKDRDLSNNTAIDLIKGKYTKDSFIEIIRNNLLDFCKKRDDKCFSREKLEETIRKAANEIIKSSEKLKEEVITNQNRIYQKENGVSYDILSYSHHLYVQLLNHFGLLGNNEANINVDNYNFATQYNKNGIDKLFNHNPSNEFAENLYKKIVELCDNLKISIKALFNYSPEHSSFDHGLISSGLLYQSAVLNNLILNFSTSNKAVKLSWYDVPDVNFFNSQECIDQYANIIFAVLLHNVATKENSPKVGVMYKQNIQINPFAFYGALCDLLQLWGRPKQINLSKSYLPEHHFLDTDFDIVAVENKIKIFCSRGDLEYVKNKINEGKTYIQGIQNIIEVHSIE